MISTRSTLLTSREPIISLKAKTKAEAIQELVEFLFEQHPHSTEGVSKKTAYDAVMGREYDFATGLGQGLAFPHARIEGWGDLAVVAGISKEGIDFSSVDQKPAYCIFLIISSTQEPYVILQSMSAILRHLKNRINLEDAAKGNIAQQDIIPVLKEVKVDPFEKIRVAHIACPVTSKVTKEMPLKDLSRLMHESRLDILPVVDKNDVFCGEVSCSDVFQIGIPDFFNQLKTVSFIKYLDPFEKLFGLEKNLTVEDVYRQDLSVLTTQDTLMEVIFEMTVGKRSKLFVVDENRKLAGVIDRFTIIDKILFY